MVPSESIKALSFPKIIIEEMGDSARSSRWPDPGPQQKYMVNHHPEIQAQVTGTDSRVGGTFRVTQLKGL